MRDRTAFFFFFWQKPTIRAEKFFDCAIDRRPVVTAAVAAYRIYADLLLYW